jgi:hypothetical protein
MCLRRWSQPLIGSAQLLDGVRTVRISRRFTFIQLALVCAALTLAVSGCGFLSMVFNGENQQALRQTGVCDSLASEYASNVPLLVELRTDKAGVTRYRDLGLGGTEVDPQWVPVPNQHADATGWIQAGNFVKLDFQPPLQDALIPGSVTYVAYAPADARDTTEQGQLKTLNSAFGPASGTFRSNGRVYRYSAMHQLPCHAPPP